MNVVENRKSAVLLYRVFFLSLAVSLLMVLSGCGVRNANVIPGKPIAVAQFSGKKVSILPVHGDASMGTDSQLQLKKAINTKIDKKFSQILPQSRISGTGEVVKLLNKNRMLGVFDELSKPYKSVGVFDENIIASLFKLLHCDYLVISELDNENIDVVAANAYLLSLDILIVNRSNEIVWSGTGDFKQGGMFGLGRVSNEQGAEEIVKLAFAYWTPTDEMPPQAVYESPAQEVEKPVVHRQSDPLVKSVQQELNWKNYNAGTADGFMGQKTRKALRQYQEDQSLPVTGRVDNETLVALGLRQAPASSSVSESTINTDRSDDKVEVPAESATKPAAKTSGSLKYVTTSGVELQAADDLFSETLVKIPAGTTLNVLSVDGDWYKVAYKKKEGYVMAEFVEQK